MNRMTYIERHLASTLKALHEEGLVVLDSLTLDVVQLVLGARVEGPYDESEAA